MCFGFSVSICSQAGLCSLTAQGSGCECCSSQPRACKDGSLHSVGLCIVKRGRSGCKVWSAQCAWCTGKPSHCQSSSVCIHEVPTVCQGLWLVLGNSGEQGIWDPVPKVLTEGRGTEVTEVWIKPEAGAPAERTQCSLPLLVWRIDFSFRCSPLPALLSEPSAETGITLTSQSRQGL